jgi:hypothetical protein
MHLHSTSLTLLAFVLAVQLPQLTVGLFAASNLIINHFEAMTFMAFGSLAVLSNFVEGS